MNPALSSSGALQAWQQRWRSLAAREQNLLLAALVLCLGALLWWLLLAPALHTLRQAPARHAQLDAQLQHMQALQAQAQALQNIPQPRSADAQRKLQTSVTQTLGDTAQLQWSGERATLTLRNVDAQALAQWLAQVRGNTQASTQEAHLTRSEPSHTDAPPATPRWNGTLVLTLPGHSAPGP